MVKRKQANKCTLNKMERGGVKRSPQQKKMGSSANVTPDTSRPTWARQTGGGINQHPQP